MGVLVSHKASVCFKASSFDDLVELQWCQTSGICEWRSFFLKCNFFFSANVQRTFFFLLFLLMCIRLAVETSLSEKWVRTTLHSFWVTAAELQCCRNHFQRDSTSCLLIATGGYIIYFVPNWNNHSQKNGQVESIPGAFCARLWLELLGTWILNFGALVFFS